MIWWVYGGYAWLTNAVTASARSARAAVAAILAPATVPIGATLSAFAQLAARVALLVAALASERLAGRVTR